MTQPDIHSAAGGRVRVLPRLVAGLRGGGVRLRRADHNQAAHSQHEASGVGCARGGCAVARLVLKQRNARQRRGGRAIQGASTSAALPPTASAARRPFSRVVPCPWRLAAACLLLSVHGGTSCRSTQGQARRPRTARVRRSGTGQAWSSAKGGPLTTQLHPSPGKSPAASAHPFPCVSCVRAAAPDLPAGALRSALLSARVRCEQGAWGFSVRCWVVQPAVGSGQGRPRAVKSESTRTRHTASNSHALSARSSRAHACRRATHAFASDLPLQNSLGVGTVTKIAWSSDGLEVGGWRFPPPHASATHRNACLAGH